MSKIVSVKKATEISKKIKENGKSLVVAGGCFDLIHIGHVRFLQKTKKLGNFVFVLVESDESVRKIKGNNRPIFPQKERAEVLEAIEYTDYIVLLPYLKNDKDYDNLINALKPTIIATTKGDPMRSHKERQAKLSGSKVIDVIKRVSKKSTSTIAKHLVEDLNV